MTMAYVAGIVSVAGTAFNMMNAPSPGAAGSQAQNMVDPFAPYRGAYGALLNQFMGMGVGGPSGGATAPPTPASVAGEIHGMPGSWNRHHSPSSALAVAKAQGLLQPSAPATPAVAPNTVSPTSWMSNPSYTAAMDIGLQGVQRQFSGVSGNELLGLQNFGVTYQNAMDQQMFNRLAMLSGASSGPGAGGAAGIAAANQAAMTQGQDMGSLITQLQHLGSKIPTSQTTAVDPGTQIDPSYISGGGFLPSGGMATSMGG